MSTHTDVPFNNSASQRERAQLLKQDLALRQLHAISKPSSGNPATVWPPMPTGSPWSGTDPLGVEPPLGRNVNALTKETKS
jgi:hypothetical protein